MTDDGMGRDRADGQQALRAGQRIGSYVLTRFIAEGGMGQVWEARDTDLQRAVALKVVRPDRVDAQSLALFAREARAGGRTFHPNLVVTFAHGTHAGVAWIAQEFVEGARTCRKWLDELHASQSIGREHYSIVARLVASVADGLHAAHLAGIIHRDVTPQNILLTAEGVPKVTDFGLARVVDETARSHTGAFAGTYRYSSPEQVAAGRMGLDHRTDVFSLGVVLYELLTFQCPFDGDTTHQIAARIVTHEPPPAWRLRSQCPRELGTIAAKALEKAPDRRYATMEELAADLRRHLAGEPIVARPAGPLVRATKWMRRHPAPTALIAVVVSALVLVSGSLWIAIERQRRLDLALAELEQQTEAARASADEARDAAALAERNAGLATARAERLEDVQYPLNIAEAARLLDAGLVARAARSLELCVERLRGWEWRWLSSKLDTSLAVITEPQGRITAAGLSPDGALLVTGSDTGTVRYWDVASRQQMRELHGHTGLVTDVEFSPAGDRVVTVSHDRSGRVWDVRTGQLVALLQGHTELIDAAAFDASGTRVVTTSNDRTARIFDAASGKEQRILHGDGLLTEPLFDPAGERVFALDPQRGVQVWDSRSGSHLVSCFGDGGWIWAWSLDASGRRVALAASGLVSVFDSRSGELLERLADASYLDAVFDPKSEGLLTAGDAFHVWQLEAGKSNAAPTVSVPGRASRITLGTNGVLACVTKDDCVSVVDTKAGTELARLQGHRDFVRWSRLGPEEDWVATLSNDGTVRIWDARGRPLPHVGPAIEDQDVVDSIAPPTFSRCGRSILWVPGFNLAQVRDVASAEVSCSVYELFAWRLVGLGDVAAGQEVIGTTWGGEAAYAADVFALWRERAGAAEKSLRRDRGSGWHVYDGGDEPIQVLRREPYGPYHLALSPDGARLATYRIHAIEIWDVGTGNLYATLDPGPELPPEVLWLDGAGERCVVLDRRGELHLWDVASGERVPVDPSGAARQVEHVAFSADGSYALLLPRAGGVDVLDVHTGRVVAHTDICIASYWTSGFSSDGRLCGIADGSKVVLFDIADGMASRRLEGNEGIIEMLAFGPDGRTVAIGSDDATIRTWDARTGAQLHVFEGHTAPVRSVVFSPDGNRILSASDDGTARLWDPARGQLLLTIQGPGGPLVAASFSPDGSRMLVAAANGAWQMHDSLPYRERFPEVQRARAATELMGARVRARLAAGEHVPAIRRDLGSDPSLTHEERVAGLGALLEHERTLRTFNAQDPDGPR